MSSSELPESGLTHDIAESLKDVDQLADRVMFARATSSVNSR